MSDIFRIYKGGNSTYEDWNESPVFPYNNTARDTIEDPDGAAASHEITSIPSPFARIDLVKNAFKEVIKRDERGRINLDGDTIFHKMVSDTLDVAEIFFNIDKYPGKVQIIKWSPQEMLAELENSNIPGHRYLADALRKYMVSDSRTYNFDQMQNIYLLNYMEGPDELNIIGATSPATLFFSNANDLSYVNDIFFGEDRPFDADYNPLYKRDFDFVRYLFALRKTIPNFAGLFPEVDAYLEETYRQMPDQQKKNELNAVNNATLADFEAIQVADTLQNNLVEVLGNALYKKADRPVTDASGFKIRTTRQIERAPLVLPVEAGNRYSSLRYTTANWGNTNRAPFRDPEENLDDRRLPFDGSAYPYLTISDLLEDSLIRVPHTLNSSRYFDGHIHIGKPELAFLLPLKPAFFQYFSPDELRGEMPDGRKMFEMKLLAGDSVSVTLRVPVAGDDRIRYIEYTRIYYNNVAVPEIENNAGNIVDMKFTGLIMPQVRFNNPADAIYNVAAVQPSSEKNEFTFYFNGEKVAPDSCTTRDSEHRHTTYATNYLLTGSNFDLIQVSNRTGQQGVLVPLFKKQSNMETFEFAIDLGTSNTHIEYQKKGGRPAPFAFTAQDRLLCEMFVAPKVEGELTDLVEETDIIEKDYLPEVLGEGDYHFPTRTVLSCAKSLDWTEAVKPFTMVNLPFTYDKRSDLIYNNLRYNIKWGTGNNEREMEAYVNCLMLMIRNKVLLNDGDLQSTQITWFYPISMANKRLERLRETWNNASRTYFTPNMPTKSMTESEAPIRYFFANSATATSLVNVDIGGGTTDIAFAKDRTINHLTSFRFASNALFENAFSEYDDHNGIIDRHKDSILRLLEEKEIHDLVRVFNSDNNAHPSNMASFLFGLKDNTLVRKRGVAEKAIDFNQILRDDEDFKIVFIVFYTSIIYHIAQITKVLGLDMPRHISFSGNGSKVIKVITGDPCTLARYTKIIFEKVMGKPYDKELEILGLDRDSSPKDSTCKGALVRREREDTARNTEELLQRTIVFKSDGSGLVEKGDTYENTITPEYKKRTVEAVKDFFNFVFDDMNAAFDFDNNFGVTSTSLRIARDAAAKDLDTFLDKGLQQKGQETKETDTIEETFFFYPIKGALNAISADILNHLQNKA